uniref:Uncharacterized protein n=1 Tax=Moniliophthora roreri TaxID=221103 RepID=A0A0W0G6S3_MONRR
MCHLARSFHNPLAHYFADQLCDFTEIKNDPQ